MNGFWSLSIYNEHHFFVANAINRFSVGTKNKELKLAADGSLTIYVQAEAPTDRGAARQLAAGARRAISRSTSAPTGRKRRSRTAHGRRRRCSVSS